MNTNSKNNTEHYLHQVSYGQRERLVGFFVFFAFILFLFFIVVSVKNQHLFEKRVTFYVDVNSSKGISQGSIVNILGAEVGRVTSLSLTQNQKIRLTIEVYEGRRSLIRTGAKALVNRLTSINNALIEIESDSVDAPLLPAGATIPVEETPSLNDLLLGIASLIQSADNNNLLGKFELLLPKLQQSLENVHTIIEQIATGHGVLGAAVFDKKVEKELKNVVTSGAKILGEAEGIIGITKQRLVQLEPVITDANFMLRDIREATQSLPGLMKELKQVISQTRSALTLVNKELNDMPGVTLDARRTLSKTEQLLDSIQYTWPLSNQISIPKTTEELIPPHSGHD